MRIAVASENGVVAQHFGRCPEYTLFDVLEGKVVNRTVVANPGHEPGVLPGFLGRLGVEWVIAGGMGPRAQSLFETHGIQTVVGVEGPVEQAVVRLLDGQLQQGGNSCHHA